MTYTKWQANWQNDPAGGTPLVEGFFDQVETTFGSVDRRITDAITINVKDYGAVGDGTTDDYTAFRSAVTAVNTAGGGTFLVPPGNYFLGQYKILTRPPAGVTPTTPQSPAPNGITDLFFTNCVGLSVLGYGAKISVKGNFNRAADYQFGGTGPWYSNEESLVPLGFLNCSRFEVCGFELNGNVNLMTKDSPGTGLAEGNGHGIATQNCFLYSLRDLYIHHFHTDGMFIGNNTTCDKQVIMSNVRSKFNARQALSLIQVRGAMFIDCELSETGNTGSYGWHPPGAGVDIEPNFGSPDFVTGFLSFLNCKLKNNIGSQITGSIQPVSVSIEHVLFRDCEIIAGTSTSTLPVALAISNGIIENCRIDTGGQFFYAGWSSPFNPMHRTIIRNNEIRSVGKMLINGTTAPCLIEGNQFIGTGTSSRPLANDFFIYLQGATQTVFRNNYVFFPGAIYNGAGSGNTYDIIASIQDVLLAENNFFETDLNPTGSTVNNHFAAGYGSAVLVRNEKYLSADTTNFGFRSGYNSTWNNSIPYSIGKASTGSMVVLSDWDNNTLDNRFVMVQAMPSSGTWRKGDLAIMANPAKGGKIGWTRLTTGTANVLNTDWQPFGAIDP